MLQRLRQAAHPDLLLEQGRFHGIEGVDIRPFELFCLLAGKTHRQHDEAVTGEGVHSVLLVSGFRERVVPRHKIVPGSVCTGFLTQFLYSTKNGFVAFLEIVGNLQRRSDGLPVLHLNNRGLRLGRSITVHGIVSVILTSSF